GDAPGRCTWCCENQMLDSILVPYPLAVPDEVDPTPPRVDEDFAVRAGRLKSHRVAVLQPKPIGPLKEDWLSYRRLKTIGRGPWTLKSVISWYILPVAMSIGLPTVPLLQS